MDQCLPQTPFEYSLNINSGRSSPPLRHIICLSLSFKASVKETEVPTENKFKSREYFRYKGKLYIKLKLKD